MDRTADGILRASRSWALPALTALLAGCGNLTAGGLTGEANVVVSGDAPDPSGAPAPALRPAAARVDDLAPAGPAARADDHDDDEPEGEIEVEFLLFLEGADGTTVALSDEEIRVRIDVRGRQEADVVNRPVPATRYTALRIVFTEIEVEVESGLVVNGVTITGPVDVELEDASLEVVRPISVDISEGARAEMVVDLNTTTWLQNVDPDLRRVAEEVFAAAIEVIVR